ncbi:hypothetical protein B296_00057684 [Ensete ventricosum]|uniref:Uncharacterized protein n=1 Tax=Ensete ventricosum TaxID=4639 RepID=A0A426XQD3_ENSVE|nr:hypothetical protein B296_00057684 [Ensete ventricosum]
MSDHDVHFPTAFGPFAEANDDDSEAGAKDYVHVYLQQKNVLLQLYCYLRSRTKPGRLFNSRWSENKCFEFPSSGTVSLCSNVLYVQLLYQLSHRDWFIFFFHLSLCVFPCFLSCD